MKVDVPCTALCTPKTYNFEDKKSLARFKRLFMAVNKEYTHSWMLDNLPAAECTENCRGTLDTPAYRLGFPVGCYVRDSGVASEVCTVSGL